MGLNQGNEVFDPVCHEIIRQVKKSDGIYPDDATLILSILIKSLQALDWDTEHESLEDFAEYDYVVKAFDENDIRFDDDNYEDEDEDDEENMIDGNPRL